MSGLSAEDREALVAAFVNSTRSPAHLAFLAEPVVEAIVARHVTAALNLAADVLDVERARLRDAYRKHNEGRDLGRLKRIRPDIDTWANAYEVAARIVRATTNSAAPVASARTADGAPGPQT